MRGLGLAGPGLTFQSAGHPCLHLQVLLLAAVESPDDVALDLPLLPQADLDLMLVEYNKTLADFPADKTLNQLFEAHASAQPDASCLVDGSSMLTYAEVRS